MGVNRRTSIATPVLITLYLHTNSRTEKGVWCYQSHFEEAKTFIEVFLPPQTPLFPRNISAFPANFHRSLPNLPLRLALPPPEIEPPAANFFIHPLRESAMKVNDQVYGYSARVFGVTEGFGF